MIPVDQLIYELDLRLNKKASNAHQGIPVEDKILVLNSSQNKLIKLKLNSNNNLQAGLDSFKKRYEDLQTLVVQFEKLTPSITTEPYTSYQGDLTALTQPYMIPLDIVAIASKNGCSGRVLAVTKIVKHADVPIYLNNSNYAPSFEWQDTIAVISDNKVIVYTDGTFKIDEIRISYLRYPTKIDKTGYVNFDGVNSTDVDCELPEYLKDELLDLATFEFAIELENNQQVQYSQINQKINE